MKVQPGPLLRKARIDRGWSIKEFGERLNLAFPDLNIARDSIAKVERGDTKMSVELLAQCSQVLEIEDWRISGIPRAIPDTPLAALSAPRALEILDEVIHNSQKNMEMAKLLIASIRCGIKDD